MIPRERLIDTARRVYRSYGFSPIDTPALEYLDRMRVTLRKLRDDLPPRAGDLRPLSEFEQRELASMGYGGHSDVEGSDSERLPLDGGRWCFSLNTGAGGCQCQ